MPDDARVLKRALRELSANVSVALAALDVEMKKPPSSERGKGVARILNALEMANDSVRYTHLGVNFRTDRKKRT